MNLLFRNALSVVSDTLPEIKKKGGHVKLISVFVYFFVSGTALASEVPGCFYNGFVVSFGPGQSYTSHRIDVGEAKPTKVDTGYWDYFAQPKPINSILSFEDGLEKLADTMRAKEKAGACTVSPVSCQVGGKTYIQNKGEYIYVKYTAFYASLLNKRQNKVFSTMMHDEYCTTEYCAENGYTPGLDGSLNMQPETFTKEFSVSLKALLLKAKGGVRILEERGICQSSEPGICNFQNFDSRCRQYESDERPVRVVGRNVDVSLYLNCVLLQNSDKIKEVFYETGLCNR